MKTQVSTHQLPKKGVLTYPASINTWVPTQVDTFRINKHPLKYANTLAEGWATIQAGVLLVFKLYLRSKERNLMKGAKTYFFSLEQALAGTRRSGF